MKKANHRYHVPAGGLPNQTDIMTGRAVFTDAYAVIPAGVQRDIVVSYLPNWRETRLWVLARPLSGFAETFSHYLMEVAAGGGSDRPDDDDGAESVLFVTSGKVGLSLEGDFHELEAGGYAYVPPGSKWTLECLSGEDGERGDQGEPSRFHWIRKRYESVEGIDAPRAFVARDSDVVPEEMPGTGGRWSTTRFVDPQDVRHDMHVNIVTFEPGGVIPFEETHVMEHGIYVLEGKAVYKLNRDWVEVEAGDFLWLRAFCPQACYAGGPGRFRYLLYKDVNRHAPLWR